MHISNRFIILKIDKNLFRFKVSSSESIMSESSSKQLFDFSLKLINENLVCLGNNFMILDTCKIPPGMLISHTHVFNCFRKAFNSSLWYFIKLIKYWFIKILAWLKYNKKIKIWWVNYTFNLIKLVILNSAI